MKLSIIILSYNTKDLLKQCLESVINELTRLQINGLKVEIIVVDNGSEDGSVEMLRKFKVQSSKFKIQLIENKENLGFAKGNNIGLKEARGEYIMLLNSDTIVKPKAIEKLINFLEGNQDVAAVSPLIFNQDGTIQKDPCYLKFPSPIFALFYYNSVLKKIAIKLFPKLLFSIIDFTHTGLVDQLPGSALIIRKNIIEKVGGLDERYPHFFEDVDLSYQLKKSNYKLMIFPKAEIIHLGGKSLAPSVKKEGIERYYYLSFHSLFLFCEKNYSFFRVFLIKAVIFFQLFLTGKFKLIGMLRKKSP